MSIIICLILNEPTPETIFSILNVPEKNEENGIFFSVFKLFEVHARFLYSAGCFHSFIRTVKH